MRYTTYGSTRPARASPSGWTPPRRSSSATWTCSRNGDAARVLVDARAPGYGAYERQGLGPRGRAHAAFDDTRGAAGCAAVGVARGGPAEGEKGVGGGRRGGGRRGGGGVRGALSERRRRLAHVAFVDASAAAALGGAAAGAVDVVSDVLGASLVEARLEDALTAPAEGAVAGAAARVAGGGADTVGGVVLAADAAAAALRGSGRGARRPGGRREVDRRRKARRRKARTPRRGGDRIDCWR